MPSAPLSPPVGPDVALHELEYAVVDVETTGHAADGMDCMTEVAAVVVRAGRLAESFSALVNPRRPIPPYIVRLTGITNAMVARAPLFADVAGDFSGYLRNRVFVAHNAVFDYGFVNAALGRSTGMSLGAHHLCTVKLAKRLLGHLPRRNLDAVSAHYGILIENRHRALGDALATARVFARMLDELGARGIHTWGDLQSLLRGRKKRPKRTALPTFMTDWRIA